MSRAFLCSSARWDSCEGRSFTSPPLGEKFISNVSDWSMWEVQLRVKCEKQRGKKSRRVIHSDTYQPAYWPCVSALHVVKCDSGKLVIQYSSVLIPGVNHVTGIFSGLTGVYLHLTRFTYLFKPLSDASKPAKFESSVFGGSPLRPVQSGFGSFSILE